MHIIDQTSYKSSNVYELLKIADFGPDPIETEINFHGSDEKQVKSTKPIPFTTMELSCKVFGIDRDAIIQRVLRAKNNIPAESKKETNSDLTVVEEQQQREIYFKKYLHSQRILRAKLIKERNKMVDPTVDMDALRKGKARGHEEYDAHEESWDEDDYFEDEPNANSNDARSK